MLIFDYPDKGVRGYRVYTSGENNIDKFKDMVDMLLYYKYNSVIIEVGGAMEYKKHPAINKKWIEFCSEVVLSEILHVSNYNLEIKIDPKNNIINT